jgi:hypothetical protein
MTQKHTPEPWRVKGVDYGRTIIFNESQSMLISGENVSLATDEANAERIVKCVNALAGLDEAQIEQLESWLKKESTTNLFEVVVQNRLLTEENERLRKEEKEVEAIIDITKLHNDTELFNAYQAGEKRRTFCKKDGSVILPSNYEGVDG